MGAPPVRAPAVRQRSQARGRLGTACTGRGVRKSRLSTLRRLQLDVDMTAAELDDAV